MTRFTRFYVYFIVIYLLAQKTIGIRLIVPVVTVVRFQNCK